MLFRSVLLIAPQTLGRCRSLLGSVRVERRPSGTHVPAHAGGPGHADGNDLTGGSGSPLWTAHPLGRTTSYLTTSRRVLRACSEPEGPRSVGDDESGDTVHIDQERDSGEEAPR